MATVCLENVSKHYAQHIILDNISLTVEKGEFMVVVGPSGCGKSTLLRLVAGLEQLSEGKILINDRCVNTIAPAERDMAMVFQSYALYPHMSVFDNMAYALKIRKFSKAEIAARVQEAAVLLQIEDYLERKPGELSGGQRQRVAMGRAMVRCPAVFLFDEPLSNLDAKLRGEMRYEIKKLHQKLKTTFLYVTHDQTEAMTMADRVLILNNGKIEQIGTPAEVYQKPASLFVAEFIGHYPINRISAMLNQDRQTLQFGGNTQLTLPEALHSSTQDITLAIRPEHIILANDDTQHAIEGRLEFIEDMGADRLLRVYCPDISQTLQVRVGSDQPLSGDCLHLSFLMHKAQLFDAANGTRLMEQI